MRKDLKIDNGRLQKLIVSALKDRRLSKETLSILQGWLVSDYKGVKRDAVLDKLFSSTFRFRSRPSGSAYKSLPAMMKYIGCREEKLVRRPFHHRMAFRIAAVVIPFLFIGTGYFFHLRTNIMKEDTEVLQVAIETTQKAQRRVTLPCGTNVTMKQGSVLEYTPDSYMSDRRVRLTGEAFFSVTGVQGNHFVVQTSLLSVTVYGTEFLIREMEDEGIAEVSLYSGSVSVRAGDHNLELNPLEQLLYNSSSKECLIDNFDPAITGSWRTELLLDDVTMEEAAGIIGDHFGYVIVTDKDYPGRTRVRARFRDAELREVMEMLKTTVNNLSYRVAGDTIYISGPPKQNNQ